MNREVDSSHPRQSHWLPRGTQLRSACQRRSLGNWTVACLVPLIFASLAPGAIAQAGLGKTVKNITAKTLATFHRFPDWVTCVTFHPQGQVVAAGSYGEIHVLDVASRKLIISLEEKAGFVKSVAYSADGRWLVTGSYQSAAVWDVNNSYRLVRTLTGHQGYVTAVEFTADGSRLITASDDETLQIWNTASFVSEKKLAGHRLPVTGAAIAPSGRWLASCSGDITRPAKVGELILWSLPLGEPLTNTPAHDRGITSIAVSPDGRFLATGSFDETIKIWQLREDGQGVNEVATLAGQGRPVNAVAFLPGSQRLVSAAGGRSTGYNTVALWDVAVSDPLSILAEHAGPVLDVAVRRDGVRIASSSSDKSCRVLELEMPAESSAKSLAVALPLAVNAVAADTKPADAKPSDTKSKEPKSLGADAAPAANAAPVKTLRAGIIGLDTSHVVAFTQVLNDAQAKEDVAGCRIVAAYPKGSPDIESSVSRVPKYIEDLKKLDVEIVDSIEALIEKVDVVLLETNDGRPHLAQVLPVLKAKKPVFIDKPIAGSLTDAVAILRAAEHYGTPVFTSSSLRYSSASQALRGGKSNIGDIVGCDAYSPCHLEKTHPDLFWYGIHGVETLFTVMGTGCETVSRASTEGTDFAVGVWKGGRIGTFRGLRAGGSGYGGTAFGAKGILPIGPYEGYRPLVVEIVKFFRSGQPPVSTQEMLEIYAFMEAADESKRQGGKPISLESVLTKAREEAARMELK